MESIIYEDIFLFLIQKLNHSNKFRFTLKIEISIELFELLKLKN